MPSSAAGSPLPPERQIGSKPAGPPTRFRWCRPRRARSPPASGPARDQSLTRRRPCDSRRSSCRTGRRRRPTGHAAPYAAACGQNASSSQPPRSRQPLRQVRPTGHGSRRRRRPPFRLRGPSRDGRYRTAVHQMKDRTRCDRGSLRAPFVLESAADRRVERPAVGISVVEPVRHVSNAAAAASIGANSNRVTVRSRRRSGWAQTFGMGNAAGILTGILSAYPRNEGSAIPACANPAARRTQLSHRPQGRPPGPGS